MIDPQEEKELLLCMEATYEFHPVIAPSYGARCGVCRRLLPFGQSAFMAIRNRNGRRMKMFYICRHHEYDQEVLL